MAFSSRVSRLISCAALALAAAVACAEPIREWNWRMPAEVYKELDFTDRAGVDRAVKLFERAVEAERQGKKVTDLVPMYRTAAGEWRKVQVQAETAGGNEPLLAYAIFMQGYAKQQAHDRNEAVKLFNEVLDLYPEEKFIAVPARYMISVVKRELGNVRQANADLEALVEDGGADGHPIYYSVLRSLAANRWAENRTAEAAELWEKIVFSKGNVDWNIRSWSRDDLIAARIVNLDFANLLQVIFVNVSQKPEDRRNALTANANWFSDLDAYWHHSVTRHLDAQYPREKKAAERKARLEKIRRGYVAWFESVASLYDGADDGWTVGLLRLKLYRSLEKPEAISKRVKDLENLVRGGKTPDRINGRARDLAKFLVGIGQGDSARNVAALAKDAPYRLRLQFEIEESLQQWKAAAMYLEELVNLKPAPSEGIVRGAKYDLARFCCHRLNTPERAVKLYQEINDPPRSLWGLCEAQRQCGKKKDAYTTLTEIVSIFPNDAPDAVFRMAEWREQDGEKEKAVGLYRQLMKHPKWKQSNASSRAHQALERLGVATGGAMTNEVR